MQALSPSARASAHAHAHPLAHSQGGTFGAAPEDTRNAGLPHDRLALIAARRAFVTLKLTFTAAAADATGPHALWLRAQVRAAEEPVDLWLLRAPLFAALAGTEPERRAVRQRVRRALEAVFPEPLPTTAFGTP